LIQRRLFMRDYWVFPSGEALLFPDFPSI
jgi:hypothetical protein